MNYVWAALAGAAVSAAVTAWLCWRDGASVEPPDSDFLIDHRMEDDELDPE